MNLIVLKGRLTRDPELKSVNGKNGETSVCKFSIAVDKTFGEGADFFNCEIWGKRAEFVDKFFTKGKEILVSGSHESRKYLKDGEDKIAWDVKVQTAEFCGGKSDTASQVNTPASIPDGMEEMDNPDEIPF